MKITETQMKKVLDAIAPGLCAGLGNPIPGQMCVEAAVCFALGLPHGDNPSCVGSAVRAFKITLNDSSWSSNTARAKGMRKLALAQIGSDTLDQMAFGQACFIRGTQTLLPYVLRKSATQITEQEHKDALEKSVKECEASKTLEEARAAVKSASASASAYAYASAYADAYAYAYTYASASAFFKDHLGDEFLTMTADIGLSVLVEMKSPGCEFLYLCEE